MVREMKKYILKRYQRKSLRLLGLLLIFWILSGCGPSLQELQKVDYTPLPGGDWEVSTPAKEGLDSMLVANLYYNAENVETNYSLLVFKNDRLIAEKYFHGATTDQKFRLQSATKSYTSAMVGIALDQGYIESVDQKMIDFFPELVDQIKDPRKKEITIRQMLQMRAGYPWEESSSELFEILYHGFYPSLLVEVPLVTDPGTHFEYSSLTSHLLGIIVARATGMDKKSFGEKNLFSPINAELGEWITDWEGYYNGHGDMYFSARDMAKFGLLYLNDGRYNGKQIVSAEFVDASLQTYTEDAWQIRIGRNFDEIGYGYQWWSVRAGDHRYNMAWGHGGQQIIVFEEYDMVIVVTADPLWGEHGGGPWRREKENLNLVADFISSLPAER